MFNFSDYLQGSYANATNIWRDHDVDIVVQFNPAFNYSLDDDMTPREQAACQASFSPAVIHLGHFRPAVIDRLVEVYGHQNVTEGHKAVRVTGESGVRLDADVVICQQFRRYYSFDGNLEVGFDQGIAFLDQRDGRLIVNFPQQHLDNGESKNIVTDGAFKKTVRVFKNARNYMIDNGRLSRGVAPSYFLQGLLYNVDPNQFHNDVERDFLTTLVWLTKNVKEFPNFNCQNGIIRLFGDTPEQWNTSEAMVFLNELVSLYSDWS